MFLLYLFQCSLKNIWETQAVQKDNSPIFSVTKKNLWNLEMASWQPFYIHFSIPRILRNRLGKNAHISKHNSFTMIINVYIKIFVNSNYRFKRFKYWYLNNCLLIPFSFGYALKGNSCLVSILFQCIFSKRRNIQTKWGSFHLSTASAIVVTYISVEFLFEISLHKR